MSHEERCVCCGAVIPEGRQICAECGQAVGAFYVGYVLQDGLKFTHSGTQQEMIDWFDREFIKPGTREIRIWRVDE